MGGGNGIKIKRWIRSHNKEETAKIRHGSSFTNMAGRLFKPRAREDGNFNENSEVQEGQLMNNLF